MQYTITDIVEKIRTEKLTEAERETNSESDLSEKLNSILIEKGDLVECVLGTIETNSGRKHGISGEYRGSQSSQHWELWYTQEGCNYIISLFQGYRNNILNPPQAPAPVPVPPTPQPPAPTYRFSRSIRKDLWKSYKKIHKVILLEAPEIYWVFDDDAKLLGDLLHFHVNKAHVGYNLTYKKETHERVKKLLRVNQIPFLVVHPNDEESYVDFKTNALKIEVGSKFEAQSGNDVLKFYIPQKNEVKLVTITRPDGTSEIIEVPIQEPDSEFTRITRGSAMARASLNAVEGQLITCNGIEYKILKIYADA